MFTWIMFGYLLLTLKYVPFTAVQYYYMQHGATIWLTVLMALQMRSTVMHFSCAAVLFLLLCHHVVHKQAQKKDEKKDEHENENAT